MAPARASADAGLSLQGDDMPDLPPETVTEETYVDEHGHTVVKKVGAHVLGPVLPAVLRPVLSLKDDAGCRPFQVTRKVIRRFVSSDGTEREEVTVQGPPQEPVRVEDGDGYSKVIKRVVLRSDTEQSEVRPPRLRLRLTATHVGKCGRVAWRVMWVCDIGM